MNELFGVKQIDQALTAAKNTAEDRLWDLLANATHPPVCDMSMRELARHLLAHADVLADILRQAKEAK